MPTVALFWQLRLELANSMPTGARYMICAEDGPAGNGQYEGHFIVSPTPAAARNDWGVGRVCGENADT